MANQSTPTPGEIVILAAGPVALIFSFFNFYKVDNPLGDDLGQSAWSKGLFPLATLMVLFVLVMSVQIALTKFANVQLPERVAGFTWEQVHLVLGFVAALYAIAFLIRNTGGADRGIGFWLILVSCIAAFVGAILLQKERAGGATGGGGGGARPGGGPTV